MKLIKNIFLALSLVLLCACEEPEPDYIWNPNWSDNTDSGEEDTDPDEEDKEDDGSQEQPTPEKNEAKARLVWIDAAANFKDYANSQQNIAADMKRLKETGFTGVVVEVRPTTAGVLFKSDVEVPLTQVDAWVADEYKWLKRTASFDYLQAFIDAGKTEGLDVYAAINTMVGGKECPYGRGTSGPLFDGSISRDWATVINTPGGLMTCMDLPKIDKKTLSEWGYYDPDKYIDKSVGARFLNPANDEVVNYLLGILEDLAAYDVKGIILDRCRYDDFDLQSDFSDVSRRKFEEYIGKPVENWPGDIFNPGATKINSPITAMQRSWMEFRAKNIHDFMEKASNKVHSVNPDIRFGAYVGAWYSSYYNSGVNWASPSYNAGNAYNWATAEYNKYGYADHCDIMLIGAYASTKSIYGTSEWTMQGFCQRAQKIFAGDVPFIGGPDIGNSTGFENGGQGKLMPDIVDACINASTEGMFFFDLCHIKMYDYWADIKKAFDQYLESL